MAEMFRTKVAKLMLKREKTGIPVFSKQIVRSFGGIHPDRLARPAAAFGGVADAVALDRIVDRGEERPRGVAERADEIADQLQVGPGVEGCPAMSEKS